MGRQILGQLFFFPRVKRNKSKTNKLESIGVRGRLLGVLGFAGEGLLGGRGGKLRGYRWVRTRGCSGYPARSSTAHVYPETWTRPRVEVCDF